MHAVAPLIRDALLNPTVDMDDVDMDLINSELLSNRILGLTSDWLALNDCALYRLFEKEFDAALWQRAQDKIKRAPSSQDLLTTVRAPLCVEYS